MISLFILSTVIDYIHFECIALVLQGKILLKRIRYLIISSKKSYTIAHYQKFGNNIAPHIVIAITI